ncbi:putative 2-dehydropantoate 2-reductase [Sphaerospermopsis kisseleviana CS-549]|jgi:2-dehydropantoate 2-reductase|uniref:2-dehydropantoate 2-reductase n=2 Tax=Sphaerospermopsis TaxID=752201 RepID=A0ABR9VHD5_9CYAN|nr:MULTISPECIES: putative 2-dehydropantoate 2-reductase [Sphaerospermopsis]BAZ80880.1 2-dehydropantoate 2-reductase [Sphaerospermopsis kisseleviana NIES-73]MBD2135334.1 putative 2-dehydropantoate 2-reductase [Sphaerospermopsis sp. FACHB-1094]MBD2144599.1 putative 2-dehydropantoate 2-reductase [Sphaerospermopsis sp. FACHB-1194]MBE9237635.1 putative 2-dehydropantoate 2-reductase [Sphaerospermopsis aphanizomenoides LEGE 00250]MDB9440668.1 putative 2-dehydropantoate 2-reductase [Sphaerospermopsis 
MGNLSYAIVGTGALGGFYGAKLQKAGNEVHFLVNSDYQQVIKHGLTIESKDGDFRLPQVQVYNQVEKMPSCDVVVVSIKTTQNHILTQILPPLVKDDSIVLVLQNGLGIETEIAQIVSNVNIIGGLCFLCSNKIAPGHIHHLDYGKITLGEYATNYNAVGITERMKAIFQDFENAGIEIELTEDLLLGRWKKLMWNIPYNGLSVILDATTDEIMADMYTRTLVEQLMKEVQLGAKSTGRIIPDSFIQTMLDYTVKMKPYRTSMKIDFDENRPLEVEAIVGNPLRIAAEHDVSLPLIRCLYQQLKFLDNRNIGDR